MRFRAAKWSAMAVLSLSAFAFSSPSCEAQGNCGLWSCLFGWCGSCGACRPTCYRPVYYGPVYGGPPLFASAPGPAGPCSTTYCGPLGARRCAPCGPVCSPCGPAYSPCGPVACAPCDSTDCAVAPLTNGAHSTPAPNDVWNPKQKTFAEPPAPGDESGQRLGEPGRLQRTAPDNGYDTGISNLRESQDDENSREFKPVEKIDDAEADGQREGTDSGARGAKSPGSSKSRKKEPAAPKAQDEDAGRLPTIGLDDKVAWRSAPARKRIEARSPSTNVRLVRLPAYPKSDWLPVESESKVASK